MIVRPRLNWVRMLFVWHGSVLGHILPQLLATTLISVVVVLLHGEIFRLKVTLTAVPFTLIGIALAVFLGFRNSASYDRFWEARKLWGGLLNESRNLARLAVTLFPAERDRRGYVQMLIAFVHSLRHQLRGTDPEADLQRLLSAPMCERLSTVRFKPAVLLLMLAESLHRLRRDHAIEPILAATMERSLAGLTEVLGGCERIAGTPLPFTYSVILHRTVYFYCFLLPFGLVDSIGVMTPLVVAFISYTFFALEALSDELESPFGKRANHLALDAMSQSIEATLRETLGETPAVESPPGDEYVWT